MVATALDALLGPLSAPPSAASSDAALDVLQAAVAALRRLADVAAQLLPVLRTAAGSAEQAEEAEEEEKELPVDAMPPPLPPSTQASPSVE